MICDWCNEQFDSVKEFVRHCHEHLTEEEK